MHMIDIEKEIRQFLADKFLFGRGHELQGDTFLLGNVIDSVGALELLAFLQDRFGVSLDDEDMVPENFDSIGSIVAYLAKKMNGEAEARAGDR